jgi:sugar O-acyltransferase (sialic acid O-acetyltransferase NeuD family)
MKIAIVGYGELGKQLHLLALETLKPTEVIIFDDNEFLKENKNAGLFDDYLSEQFKEYHFIVALGYKHFSKKKDILEKLQKANRVLPSIIHPSSFVSSSAIISEAVYVFPMCNIDKNVKICSGVLLNNSVTISHDSTIGASCYLSPGVVVSGFVQIGEETFLGSGCIVSNNIQIGKKSIIGIGSVITCNIPDKSSAIGNPARIIDKRLNLI